MLHKKMIIHSSVFLNECNNKSTGHVVVYSPIPCEKNQSLLITESGTATTPMSSAINVSSPSVTKMPPIELLSNDILGSNRVNSNRDEALTETRSIRSSHFGNPTPYGTIKTIKSQRSVSISRQAEVEMNDESDFDDFTLASNNAYVMTAQSLSALQAETQVGQDSFSSTAVDRIGDLMSFVSFRRPNFRCCRFCYSSLPSAANFCPQCGSLVEVQSEQSPLSNMEAESSFSSSLVSPSLSRDPNRGFITTPPTPSCDFDSFSERSTHHQRVYRRRVLILCRHEKGMLGCGTNGTVYKAIDLVSGQQLAVKEMCINLKNTSEIVAIRNELRHLSRLRHPKVIEYYGCSIKHATPKSSTRALQHPLDTAGAPEDSCETIQVYILMERVECGTLQELLKNFPDGLPDCTVRVYASQLLEAIHYVHQCGISHCDIKPSNLLLASDGTIKLADFGCAKMKAAHHPDSGSSERELAGTPVYMPPETLHNLSMENADWVFLGQAQDIWALGCVVHQLLTGKMPWAFTKISSPFALLSYIQAHPQFPLADGLSPCALDFCRLCLELDPRTRVENVREILASPFISNRNGLSQW